MKKNNSYSLHLAVAAAIGMIAAATPASAVSLTYDANTSTAGAQDGAGNGWNTTNLNWFDGTNDVVWANTTADTAVFGAASGGTGGTVVVGTVNAGLIQFNPQTTTGYTLSTGTITLGTGITTTSTVNSVISAKISGTSGLALNGLASATTGVTLSGANDYTGITVASTGGRFTASNATALGSTVGATTSALGTNYTQINSGVTVQISNSTSEAFLINGGGSNTAGALRLANNVNLTSLVQLGSDAAINGVFSTGANISGNVDLNSRLLSWSSNGSNTINGTISGLITNTGTTGTGINIGGSGGVLNITNNANTYTGTTTVAGTLGLGGDTVLGNSTLALGGTVQSTDATARTIANLLTFNTATFGATSVNTGTLTFTNATPTTLGTVTTKTFTTNVDVTFNTPITGGAASTLTKLGAAALIFTGSNTYAGDTIVSAGSLLVNNSTGSGTGSGAVSVTGATLGGNGIIGGITGATSAVTANTSGIVAPGDAALAGGIGTLTIGSATVNRNMVFGAGSAFNIQVSGATSDLLSIFGNLDLSTATDTLNISGTLSGSNYVIANYTGTLTGTFNSVTGLTGGYTVDYSTPGSIILAVPEPSTYAMLIGGVCLMFGARRLRRRVA